MFFMFQIISDMSDQIELSTPGVAAGMSRDLEKAQAAYAAQDAAASIAAHTMKKDANGSSEEVALVNVEDHGGSGSQYIKSVVFGGLDGIMTVLGIVTSAAGANLSIEIALVMGYVCHDYMSSTVEVMLRWSCWMVDATAILQLQQV
jgi:hypothetical protein